MGCTSVKPLQKHPRTKLRHPEPTVDNVAFVRHISFKLIQITTISFLFNRPTLSTKLCLRRSTSAVLF